MARKKVLFPDPEPITAKNLEEMVLEPLETAPEAAPIEVEDLESLEVGKDHENFEVVSEKHGNESWQVLKIPRTTLFGRFAGRNGILELQRVLASPWLKNVLSKHGFNNPSRFVKNDRGRFLVPDPDSSEFYRVSQRV